MTKLLGNTKFRMESLSVEVSGELSGLPRIPLKVSTLSDWVLKHEVGGESSVPLLFHGMSCLTVKVDGESDTLPLFHWMGSRLHPLACCHLYNSNWEFFFFFAHPKTKVEKWKGEREKQFLPHGGFSDPPLSLGAKEGANSGDFSSSDLKQTLICQQFHQGRKVFSRN